MDSKDYSIHLVREAVFDEETPSNLSTKIRNNKLPTNIFNNDNYIYELPIINSNENENTYDDSGKLIYNEESNEESNEENTESKENNSSSRKGKESEIDSPVSSIKNNNINKIINTPITNNKKDEINNSAKSKEPEDNFINDEKIESIDDLASDFQSISVSNDESNFSGDISRKG